MNKVYKKDCESYCEYTLPDYLGDVKKILSVNSYATPSGKFVGDGEVEYSGIVTYDLLYSDSEGKLTRLTTTSDYDINVAADSAAYVDSFSEPRIASVSVRLTGPRKLVAKAVVSNSVTVATEETVETSGTAFAEGRVPELAKKDIREEKLIFISSPEREYAEEAERVSATAADDIEIISSSGTVRVTESTPIENGVNVKGDLIITAIIRTSEQPAFAIRKIIPFDEDVSIEGVKTDMNTMVDGYLTSVTAGVAEDGEDSVITVSAILELVGFAGSNVDSEIITDGYLLESATEAEYENYTYRELVEISSTEQAVNLSILRSDIGCEYIRNVLSLSADVRSLEKTISKKGINLSGDIHLSGVACEINEDNSAAYVPIKFTSAISVDINTENELPEGAEAFMRVSVVDVESSLDPERLNVKCSLKIGGRVTKTNTVKRMTVCNEVGALDECSASPRITVYYPDGDETLFDIAKRFHTTGARIASDNALSEQTLNSSNSLLSVKKLIIR